MKAVRISIVVGFLTMLVWVISAPEASAIPTWSRRYNTACVTCHVLPPKLNPFGVAFKNLGYRLPGDEEPLVKQPDVPMGAPAWKQVWPKGVWPGAIPDRVPLSVHMELATMITPSERVKVDFGFPTEFEMMAGGTLGSSFSFLGELAFEFENGETVVEFERGHLGINKLFNTHLLNLNLGRFETRATPFSRFSRRITDADFIVSDFRPVPGSFRFRARQQGFELWGAKNGPKGGGFEYGLGLVNGSGAANDNNSQKDYYASASYKFGGMGVLGPTTELTTLPSGNGYIDDSVQLGVFGYVGRLGAEPVQETRFNRIGFKVDAWIDRLNIFGAYVHGRERPLNPGKASRLACGGPVAKCQVGSDAFFVEGNVMLAPWVMGILRYDQAIGPGDYLHVKRLVPGAAFMLRANVILSAEAKLYAGEKNRLFNGGMAMNEGVIRLAFLF